ncbi:putative PRAME family member 26 [Perognathus longimembris pacificus]|uniref:putative PRAME family member 26 n=1 Tax=Perognathus longimembris pacificus TaxID=214514 RepID=UPI002019983F|nr:putative PRAME family member 26 [Perognathus longimembris pacificus]XP_048203349.1 putative PRAME family member 26 [Perognathus longimembris pacificus]
MSKEQRRAADCHRLPSVPGFEVAVAGALRSHRAQVWSVKMSMRSAPTLQRLAMHSLLSNPSLAISALEDVPVLLFPSLFLEAYAQGLTEVLKAMKDRPSRWKLHVLDLRSAYPNIWKRGYPHMMRVSCPDILPEEPTARPGSEKPEEQQPLMIVADLTIKDGPQDAFQAYLLGWARKRKARVQLCCRQLQILSPSTHQIQKALRAVRPDSIRELVVNSFWHRETMKRFAPSLSRMKNLELLDFSKMSAHVYTSRSRNFWYSRKYAAHLGQLQRLQELRLHDVFFLRGQLPAILRSQTPLKTLSLTACPLKEADLRFLSQCPCTRRLKHLRLRSLLMADFSPEPLRALLEHVAGTLETLALEDCAITDGQLSAILPALGRCSQLRFLSFYGNRISMATLHSLLSHTASLGRLSQGLYPAPLESFLPPDWCLGHIHPEAFAQVRARLAQAWRDSGTTQKLQICTDFCHRRHKGQFYSLGSDGYWVVTHEALPALSALPV